MSPYHQSVDLEATSCAHLVEVPLQSFENTDSQSPSLSTGWKPWSLHIVHPLRPPQDRTSFCQCTALSGPRSCAVFLLDLRQHPSTTMTIAPNPQSQPCSSCEETLPVNGVSPNVPPSIELPLQDPQERPTDLNTLA